MADRTENFLKTLSKIVADPDCLKEKFENMKKKYDELIEDEDSEMQLLTMHARNYHYYYWHYSSKQRYRKYICITCVGDIDDDLLKRCETPKNGIVCIYASRVWEILTTIFSNGVKHQRRMIFLAQRFHRTNIITTDTQADIPSPTYNEELLVNEVNSLEERIRNNKETTELLAGNNKEAKSKRTVEYMKPMITWMKNTES